MSDFRPLKNLRVLVTRSTHQADKLSARLSGLGAVVIAVPVIAVGPPDSFAPLDSAIEQLECYDWILFASVNAVRSFCARLEVLGRRPADLARTRLAAIGRATAEALRNQGLVPAFCPSRFVGEQLIAEFPGYPELNGVRILWPRTNVGRAYVEDKLKEAGAYLDVVEAYKTNEPEDKEAIAARLIELLANQKVDVVTLASSQSVKNLHGLLWQGLIARGLTPDGAQSAIHDMLTTVVIASIGPETSRSCAAFLGRVDAEAQEFTIDGLVNAVIAAVAGSTRSPRRSSGPS